MMTVQMIRQAFHLYNSPLEGGISECLKGGIEEV
jgi:hypothetical protein